jgi:exonuclease SbcD
LRFLHTADWHVGKTLRGHNRTEEHRAVLEEIVAIAEDQTIDIVLVAGDLFDSAAPSPEAEKVVYNALLGLAKVAEHVLVIPGNHDNPRRLEAVQPLLKLTNVHVSPILVRPEDGGVITIETKGGESAQVAFFPFLSQRGIIRAQELMEKDAAEHSQAYAERATRIIARLCEGFSSDTVNIFMGHAMLQNGVLGGGERQAHTIFEYGIPTLAFPSTLHYAALGHLHRAQKLAGACPIWFSGSPLQLDFSETEDSKSVNIIEAEPGLPAQVESHPLQSGRHLRTVRGTPEVLAARTEEFGDDYLRVEVDSAPFPGLADQIREMFPNVIDVRILAQKADSKETPDKGPRLGRSPQDLFTEYLKERGEDNDELKVLFSELLEEVYASDET